MKAVVTGGAGFIGSRLAESLLRDGHSLRIIDCMDDYYCVKIKRSNLDRLSGIGTYQFLELDLGSPELNVAEVVAGADWIFHLAGQPGVRASWDRGFLNYERNNIRATQQLLEAAIKTKPERVVYASSSSVYGETHGRIAHEGQRTIPASPYGVTKLAAENLCSVYAATHEIPVVSLRYFTVFGAGQRPDMAFHRAIQCGINPDARPFPLYGSGYQKRDFTHVADVVRANILAATAQNVVPGEILNIAGGLTCSLNDALTTIEAILGHRIRLDRLGIAAGDVGETNADVSRAAKVLGWRPQVSLVQGLEEQIQWQRDLGL